MDTLTALDFLDRKIAILLYLQLVHPSATYNKYVLRSIHDLNQDLISDVENDPVLCLQVLQSFGSQAQIITVLDRDEIW